MSLADQIVKRNEEASDASPSTDEFGIPIPEPETPEYLVARALLIDTRAHEGEPRIHGLHTRRHQLYSGHTPLKETIATLYELTHLRRRVADWEAAAFWRELKKRVPALSRRCLEITDDLYWDLERGELVSREEAGERSKI